MYGEGGDDEATESAIELVGRCAEELGVGTEDVFVSVLGCLDVFHLISDYREVLLKRGLVYHHRTPAVIRMKTKRCGVF